MSTQIYCIQNFELHGKNFFGVVESYLLNYIIQSTAWGGQKGEL